MLFLGPILIFLLLAAPGVRLLLLASRTRLLPEFWGGLYFLGAAIGISLRVLGSSLFHDDRELGELLNVVGHLCFATGTIAMALFTLIVFRRSSPGGRLVAALMTSAIVGTTAHTLLGGHASIENSLSIVATNFTRLLPTSWAFYESFGYWRAMRRREALGLADPILTNRFLLWSIWTGAVTLLPMVPLGLRTLGIVAASLAESTPIEVQLQWLETGLMGLRFIFIVVAPVAAVSLSLSFFPPARYLDRVRERSERSPATAAEPLSNEA